MTTRRKTTHRKNSSPNGQLINTTNHGIDMSWIRQYIDTHRNSSKLIKSEKKTEKVDTKSEK